LAGSRGVTIGVCAVASALLLAGCGSRPAESGGGSTGGSAAPSGTAFNACMVLDTGGVDDKSFNQSSYAGMTAANAANSSISISYVPSNSGNDYTPNLNAEVTKGCDPVIAVGGLMFDNVTKAAKANPNTHFAEVDAGSSAPNMYGLQFNTAQGAFLGGYLAAGMSKTGKVATWGGLAIPPVTIYMDGFWEGVQYYNQQKNKNVQVLGWDEKKQKSGTFSQSFTDQNKGKQISQTFVQQGADVIFPVAGGAGLGAGAAAQATSACSGSTPTVACRCRSTASTSCPASPRTWPSRCRPTSSRRRAAPSRPVRTSARCRTTARAWLRSTTSTPRFRPT
jgi:basic membrane protein A